MGTPVAPRIDERLRRTIRGASSTLTPAELTRQVGNLAWKLGLPRPSYESVRVIFRRTRPPTAVAAAAQTSRGRVVLRHVVRALDVLYQYPAPGLEKEYRRLVRGPRGP